MARLQAAGFTSIGLITDTEFHGVSGDLRPALLGSALVHAGGGARGPVGLGREAAAAAAAPVPACR
jgi:hypothetical protein